MAAAQLWYDRLLPKTRQLVQDVGFKVFVTYLSEAMANGILVQALTERWWDTTYMTSIG